MISERKKTNETKSCWISYTRMFWDAEVKVEIHYRTLQTISEKEEIGGLGTWDFQIEGPEQREQYRDTAPGIDYTSS